MPYLVLQECATDSEELIYPIRAPSSCSAPPDLLLTGDRNKDAKVQSATPRNDAIAPDRMLLEVSLIGIFTLIKTHTLFNTFVEFKLKFSSAFSTNYTLLQITIRFLFSLQEFTCDVSVEGGGKSTQPLQFSFTFYDLDGHHGKITKDVSLRFSETLPKTYRFPKLSKSSTKNTQSFCFSFSGHCWYRIYDLRIDWKVSGGSALRK